VARRYAVTSNNQGEDGNSKEDLKFDLRKRSIFCIQYIFVVRFKRVFEISEKRFSEADRWFEEVLERNL